MMLTVTPPVKLRAFILTWITRLSHIGSRTHNTRSMLVHAEIDRARLAQKLV
jgi:hypothetical protein